MGANNQAEILIDGSRAEQGSNYLYRGQGMISCNGSSRLLLDYREKHPEQYWKILELLFGERGLGFTHFKVELGADVNTSSGTEPMTVRTEDEAPDVRRGAGFRIAADVKKIAPDVTLDMLWWSEPRWVTDAGDVYAARYRWYKLNLEAAYETYGLRFDHVSANRNERAVDKEWIKYLSRALKAETDCPYDFSKIKIVAADECGSWNISWDMTDDPELCGAVDVIGSHYTSFADERTLALARKKGKEIWFSEGSAPMVHAPSAVRFDEGRSGLTGINGVLDVANRMITMVPMTLYEYQPAVAAYYDGVNYCQKQLITANTPWNGAFSLDSGFFMSLHFSRFFKKGWRYIPSACRADGKPGGDGHCIVGSRCSYMTACGPEGDWSAVLTNSTAEPIDCRFRVRALNAGEVHVYETRGPEPGQGYDANYFRHTADIAPEDGSFVLTLKPYSLVTVSTLTSPELPDAAPARDTLLELPYAMDLDLPEEDVARRGGAPLYTTDQGGAFEISGPAGERFLEQKITPDIKADEWGCTPEPTTNFGDDRWYDYSISAQVMTAGEGSYAGVGLRYDLAAEGMSGYSLRLYHSGRFELYAGGELLKSDETESFDPARWHSLTLTARRGTVTARADGRELCVYEEEGAGCSAGRAALYSSYDRCRFRDIRLEPASPGYWVTKLGDCDPAFSYSPEGWDHVTMDSFRSFRRTLSKGAPGSWAELKFEGTGAVLTGAQEGCAVKVILDGGSSSLDIPPMGHRRSFLTLFGLTPGRHTLRIEVTAGTLAVDEAQIIP